MILDGGTTSLQMVQHLPLDLRATVVTHSPVVTVALAGHLQIERASQDTASFDSLAFWLLKNRHLFLLVSTRHL